MKPLLAIVGPTATGKTRLAIELAGIIDGEIINADSRQIYRSMDIITAKPLEIERNQVRHHLVDIVDPDQAFSLAEYRRLAFDAIADIHCRGKVPILAGGSGLYVWAILEGWEVPEVEPDEAFRQKLYRIAEQNGTSLLYQDLKRKDPQAAEAILPSNLRRIVRALEVHHATGKPFSQQGRKRPPCLAQLIVGLTAPREELYKLIDARVDRMVEKGMVEEVKCLMEKGYGLDLPSMSGIGYRQMVYYLRGKMEFYEALHKIKNETHRFARKQYAWFRLDDARIHWFDVCSDFEERVKGLAGDFIAGNAMNNVENNANNS